MSLVREATLEDLKDLTELGEEMFEFSGLEEFYPFSPEVLAAQFKSLIESDEALVVVLATPKGIQGVLAAVSFIGIGGTLPVTYEQYIFVREEHRGGSTIRKFLKAYHAWGERLGAVMQFMVSHEDHDKFERFYSLYGYKASERTYIRKNT
jgi:GNAT superfamily N-acetyltransferase